jgi:hypothetical protein
VASESSQPIARWEPSSQPELLWDIIAGRTELVSAEELEAIREAVPSPPLSQEHTDAVTSAAFSLPLPVVEQSILAMETVLSQSQGREPDVTQIPVEVLNELRKIIPSPASRLPQQIARTPSFQHARESGSKGSSPMDISPPPPGLLSAVPVHRFIAPGDNPDIPIILSSDSDSVQLASQVAVVSNTGEGRGQHDSSSLSSFEYERSSDRIITTASEGHDPAHAILITPTNSSIHSSIHSSDRVSVPDMGPIARGGRMQDKSGRKAAVLRALTEQVDTGPLPHGEVERTSLTPSLTDEEVRLDLQNVMVARSLLSTGLAVDQLVTEQLAAEANRTNICMAGELNDARLGYSHYFLRELIVLLDKACMSVESPILRRMLDVVGAVLSTGPRWSEESDADVWTMLPPGDWFRVCTYITAAMTHGCVRTKSISRMGNFPFEPCRDDLIHSSRLPPPATQLSGLQALVAQLQEEIRPEGALLPQDSVDGLRATIWRAHEGLIREATLAQVNSVYSRISTMGLAELVDKVMAEESMESITDTIRDDIREDMRGKFAGLIAAEKTKAYNAALDEARSEALKEAQATGAREAAQKGRSYSAMLLSRAEDEAKIAADKAFKSRLMSERSKIALRVEAEIKAEHAAALEECRRNLAGCLAEMSQEAEVDFIRTNAVRLGLLGDPGRSEPNLSKRAKVSPTPVTATKARKVARSRAASLTVRSRVQSPAGGLPHKPTPPPVCEPSPCLVAGEDDVTPRGSPTPMDWADSSQEDPLPVIDFEADTRSTGASIHAPGNEMIDDPSETPSPPEVVPHFIARIRDPESVAPPSLSASPTPPPSSDITKVLEIIVDHIGAIERKFGYMQDVIEGRQPTIPKAGVGLVPVPRTLNPPSAIITGGPVPIPAAPRLDDNVQDFPPLSQGVGRKAVRKSNASRQIANRNAEVPGAPAQGNNGFIPTRSRINMSFATTTVANIAVHTSASLTANQAQEAQKQNPSGRMKAGYSNAPTGFTDVVVIRKGGSEDRKLKESFRKCNPADIAQAVQRELNRVTANPPIILRGKWSDTVAKTGNYVFRLAGNLSAEVVHSYGPILCSIFPGEASIVPTRGWTWIQLRGVDVEYMEDDVGYAFDEADLLKAFRANPCFAKAVLPVPPYWQGNPLNFTKQTATVIAAILDEDNAICQQASREGVCMFGRQIKFVHTGNHPSLIQCARCHELGHNASSSKCRTPKDQSRCFICGKGHQSQHHSFECNGPHKTPGTCDCVPKCLLCKQSGHTSRDRGCPRHGDFAPPRLPRAAPVEAAPPVEDALKEAAIPHMRRAQPVKGGGGSSKGKKKATETVAPLYLSETCSNDDDIPRLLCFCCPMLQFAEYQELYVGKNFVSADAPKLADGKDIIQLHSEFTIRKSKDESFIRDAQKKFPDDFHSDSDLADIIN